MSDIMYLAQKEKDGKLRNDEGFLSATGDLASLQANSGKDMYIARAKCIAFNNAAINATVHAAIIVLKINDVVKETANLTVGPVGSGSTAMFNNQYEFTSIGHKVVAADIIKLEVTSLAAGIDVEGFIETFEENTGDDPRLAAQTQGTATITGGLNEIEDLKGKELIFVTGEKADSITGELVAYTPATGKTFVLVAASVFVENASNVVGAISKLVVEVKNDTSVRDELGGTTNMNPSSDEGGHGAQPFKNISPVKGDTLVGNSSKKYSLNVETNVDCLVHGAIFGYIEDT